MNTSDVLDAFFANPPDGIVDTPELREALRNTIINIARLGPSGRFPLGPCRLLPPAWSHKLIAGALRISKPMTNPPTEAELVAGVAEFYAVVVDFLQQTKTPLPVDLDIDKPTLKSALRDALVFARGMNLVLLASPALRAITGNNGSTREVVRLLFRLITTKSRRALRRECDAIRLGRGMALDWAPPLQADEDPLVTEEMEIE